MTHLHAGCLVDTLRRNLLSVWIVVGWLGVGIVLCVSIVITVRFVLFTRIRTLLRKVSLTVTFVTEQVGTVFD